MNYYDELPEGYKEYKVIDAKKTSTAIIFNIISIVVMVIVLFLGIGIKSLFQDFEMKVVGNSLVLLMYILIMVVYVILHELAHGLCYKIYTKKKLTFGLSLSCAYCGVPSIYVKKIPMIITVLAPAVIFTIIMVPVLFLLPADINYFMMLLIFGLHLGGCSGDIYFAVTLIKAPKDVLLNDTGPKQTFYKR